MLTVGSSATIFAQATPEAGGGGGPALGDAVVISDADGEPSLQIAVTELNDPDEIVKGADRGFHIVSAQVVVNNPTDADIEFNSYAIQLIDGEGFLSSQTFISRDNDDYAARPDFSESTVPAGQSISGWLFFQVINGAESAWVVYTDSYINQQFTVLANLQGTELADGDPITFYNTDAEEAGTITVDEIIMDFQKVDSSVDVERGTTAVAINVTVENTGTTDLANVPTFYLVDDFGFQYYQTYSFRDTSTTEYPDLPSDPPAAGESISGVVLFNIAKGAEVSYILAQPDYTQLYIVAQPGEGSIVSGDTLTPVPVATTDDSGDDTGTVDDEPTEDTGTTGEETGDCVGVNDWVNAVTDELSVFDEIDALNGSLADADPGELHDAADQMHDTANNIADLDTPDVAQDTSDVLVDFIDNYADLIDEAADRLDNGDDPQDIEDDLSNNTEFFDGFTQVSNAVDDLSQTCPDSNVDLILS
jgi:hypothetical protein